MASSAPLALHRHHHPRQQHQQGGLSLLRPFAAPAGDIDDCWAEWEQRHSAAVSVRPIPTLRSLHGTPTARFLLTTTQASAPSHGRTASCCCGTGRAPGTATIGTSDGRTCP